MLMPNRTGIRGIYDGICMHCSDIVADDFEGHGIHLSFRIGLFEFILTQKARKEKTLEIISQRQAVLQFRDWKKQEIQME